MATKAAVDNLDQFVPTDHSEVAKVIMGMNNENNDIIFKTINFTRNFQELTKNWTVREGIF